MFVDLRSELVADGLVACVKCCIVLCGLRAHACSARSAKVSASIILSTLDFDYQAPRRDVLRMATIDLATP
jgi:hypothetical protein